MDHRLDTHTDWRRVAFENTTLGLGLADLDGNWLEANPALCRITGLSREQLFSMPFWELVQGRSSAHGPDLRICLLEGVIRSYHGEKRFHHQAGRMTIALVSAAVIRDAASAPACFLLQAQRLVSQQSDGVPEEDCFFDNDPRR